MQSYSVHSPSICWPCYAILTQNCQKYQKVKKKNYNITLKYTPNTNKVANQNVVNDGAKVSGMKALIELHLLPNYH